MDDIKKLITGYRRRLQKLKERKASLGLDTPPHILTEIEDIEAEIEGLQAQLKQIESIESNFANEKKKSGIGGKIIGAIIGIFMFVVAIIAICRFGNLLALPTRQQPSLEPTFTPRPALLLPTAIPTPRPVLLLPTAIPTLKPIEILTEPGDNKKVVVAAHQPVIIKWWWGVCDQDVLQDNLDAFTCEIIIDGNSIAIDNMVQYLSKVLEEPPKGENPHMWVANYSYPIGSFESGSSHLLKRQCQLSRVVTDGCNSDRVGNPDIFGPGYLPIRPAIVNIIVEHK